MAWKKPLFALVTLVLLFGTLELVLWLAGVETRISQRDPFQGFSRQVRVFEADDGMWRTPGRVTQHSFNFQQFAEEKPSDGYRIFALGGSSAYGFPWGAEEAFPRVLRDALAASHPERSVEAINAAAMSYGSHRLRILMHELVEHEPDLFVIYSGHNEFIERRFYSDHLTRPQALDGLTRVLSYWRLYSLLAELRDRAVERPAPDDEAGVGAMLGIDVARETPSELVDAERAEVLARFTENLTAIVALARAAGAEIVLCTVPSNIADWKPNASRSGRTLTSSERRDLDAALERADPTLVKRFPDHAGAWYVAGRALRDAGRLAEARGAFERARDLDAAPSRAPSAINSAIREVAAASGAHLVDIEQAFDLLVPGGLLGFNLFEDYVHPKPHAHKRIALELWQSIEREGLVGTPRDPDPAAFWAAVGGEEATPSDAPIAAQTPAALFNLGVVLQNQGLPDQAMEKYRACLELHPGYHHARANLGRLLLEAGRIDEATVELRRTLEDEPTHLRALLGLAEARRRSGDLDEALGLARRATQVDARAPAAWRLSGLLSFQRRDLPAAERALGRAVELAPESLGAQLQYGAVLLGLDKLDQAERAFNDAQALAPDANRARNGLAAVAAKRGEYDRARALYDESLRFDPQDGQAQSGRAAVERLAREEDR